MHVTGAFTPRGRAPKAKHFERGTRVVNRDSRSATNQEGDSNSQLSNKIRPPQPRPTHFLSLSLASHENLQRKLLEFNQALSALSPSIRGLDKTILVDPRRIHLTLGVMTLSETPTTSEDEKTLTSALSFLASLRRRLLEMTSNAGKVDVPLNRLGLLKPERRGTFGNVLWVGPDETDVNAQTLKSICDFVHDAFKQEGFVVETRPLKLHCTLLNTAYRKPSRSRKEAFSFLDILQSQACSLLNLDMSQLVALNEHDCPRTPLSIDLGTYSIDKIHLCRMGSHGPNNEYISCGSVHL
ncbi:hypothetical protein FISHEDRAFT_61214 [Fistulina hepatica ATCC 64428]|uniref:A-kinase anchor protein 7-like phosphoesterase domain-containing protein n=1 Tax=Fistulina hepatica ATCC 64428 TaxID=1128425 RepID=A0A0D7A3X2_9AGAR|nr:hypothetical protein FISHEDRAFT_61214 [Fistulina hepatica ATCC 64428]